MLASTGCSSGKKSSSSEETSAAETVQTSGTAELTEETEEATKAVPDIHANDGNMYQTMYFSFSVGDNVKYKTHEDRVQDGENYFHLSDKRSFEFTCEDEGIEEISIHDTYSTNCTPEFHMKKQESYMAFDENGWTLSKNGDNDIASYCTSLNYNTGTCEAVAEVLCQGKNMTVYAVCKPESLENAKNIVNEITQSAKYTGTYHYPTGEQSYDGKHFSAKCDLPWEMLAYEKDHFEYMEFSWLGIDDYKKYAVSLELYAFSETPSNYLGAIEFADEIYKSKKVSSSKINVKRGNEELMGFDAYTVECDEEHSDYTEHQKYWYFDHDGLIFEVIGTWCKDDAEYEAEVMKLTDAIEIK